MLFEPLVVTAFGEMSFIQIKFRIFLYTGTPHTSESGLNINILEHDVWTGWYTGLGLLDPVGVILQ